MRPALIEQHFPHGATAPRSSTLPGSAPPMALRPPRAGGSPPDPHVRARHGAEPGGVLPVRWNTRGSHDPGGSSRAVLHRLHTYLQAGRHERCHQELARAEVAGEASEFCVLNFRALLAIIEGSEHIIDYLEMAEAIARLPHERAVIAENRAAYDLARGDPFAAARRCVAALERVCQTEGLWIQLLIALYQLGEIDTIDATLNSFSRLNEKQITRLVTLLSSEPALHAVRARPACKRLLRSVHDSQG
jgi:hypothetical protein